MVFENINLLDIEFYNSLPIWIYISLGFGVLLIINGILICCYCCSLKKLKENIELKSLELDRRELKINKRELEFEIKVIEKKQVYDDDLDDIVLSKPALYSETRNI
jgi:hypothetical protein